jgi:hypothetical protein
MTQDKCGALMRMTNSRTGAQVVVRLVDMCGNGGELEHDAYRRVLMLERPELTSPERCSDARL